MSAFELASRSVIAFMILFVWCRILGKKLMSQMTFFDFAAGVTIGTITGSIIFTNSLSMWKGFAALSVFSALALLSGLLAMRSLRLRKLLNGEPTLLIKKGQILEQGMKKARITMDDLLMMLRKKSAFYPDEVELAYFESDGTLSVLKKSDLLPVTPKDLNLTVPTRGQSQTLIIDGRILPNSVNASGKDIQWINQQLKNLGVERMSDVALAQIDQLDKLYVDLRQDSGIQ
ncbi:DUF421 domain-containing protein [Cohnella lubricantis]|uniref:DUF421 domain-containing protein n=1 Tax=Cohnella lubricantis TaxID=2163172 RepID=A0A841T7P7_9BACL|nr:DUF421 domain-containing protein [Cohnella lubricantis]MBB6677344.1 DUF421 domain-containing protein [Cohnella lubricantis]MBP2119008.1 uncharacterized membrane protein YcaP (DUF421 family) [Cohnella lubricantis]